MYATTTTVRGVPQAVDDGIARVRQSVWPALQRVPGCVGLSMLADRESGRSILTAAWLDEPALRAGTGPAVALGGEAAAVLGGTPEVAEWEIARVHRVRPTGEGGCVRVTWGRTRPDQLDRDLDVFTYSMVPELEEVPGFCSVSQLVDRRSGRSATAVGYASRTALTRAARQVTAMREEFVHMTGVQVLEVADLDLVVAHLRVPEMA